MDKARAAATRALELDPTLAEAHKALAIVGSALEWNWQEAERRFLRAIELNPTLADAHSWYAGLLVAQGRLEQAIEQSRLAVEHAPAAPDFFYFLGVLYHFAGDDARAFAQLEDTLEMFGDSAAVYQTLGMMHAEHGRHELGISLLEQANELSGDASGTQAALAYGHALAGHRDRAEEFLRELEARAETQFVLPTDLALAQVALGRHDDAFASLEQAYQMRLVLLPAQAAAWPPLEPLRSDPRFADLMKRMGLPVLLGDDVRLSRVPGGVRVRLPADRAAGGRKA